MKLQFFYESGEIFQKYNKTKKAVTATDKSSAAGKPAAAQNKGRGESLAKRRRGGPHRGGAAFVHPAPKASLPEEGLKKAGLDKKEGNGQAENPDQSKPETSERERQDLKTGGKGAESGKKKTRRRRKESEDDAYKWYILKTKANCELKAKESLLKIIKARGMESQIREIRIPERETVQVVKGKKVTRFQRIYPGYIFVDMKLGGEVWHSIQSAPNVSHFIGGGKPFELPKEQLARIHQKTLEEAASPKIQMSFSEGESVKVIDGPFKNFSGAVAEVNQEKGRVKVLVSIFGRPTPIDFDFAQVYKEF